MRLSASNFAGTARTPVAVGTASDASMFSTIFPATPRRTMFLAPLGAGAGFGCSAAGVGLGFSAAGAGATAFSTTGVSSVGL